MGFQMTELQKISPTGRKPNCSTEVEFCYQWVALFSIKGPIPWKILIC